MESKIDNRKHLDYRVILIKSKELKREFRERPERFRIEAVIHDGQWYTKEKWAKISLTTVDKITEYIQENKAILHEMKGSYRVGYDEVIDWYDRNGLYLSKPIVPNNFTPKLWAGKTEAEHFLNAPKKWVSSITIKTKNREILEKIKKITDGYGRFQTMDKDIYTIYCLNANLIKSRIFIELSVDELAQCTIRTRASFRWRELTDLPEEFLSKMAEFYFDYAFGILKPHRKTMQIFLDQDGEQAQVYDWLLSAIQKFDETEPVPFSGYLTVVLNRWPYDLPDNELGKDLAKFQRERASVVNNALVNNEEVSDSEICKRMGYKPELYARLNEQNERWLMIKRTEQYYYEDNGEEKVGMKGFGNDKKSDPKIRHKLSVSLLKACVETDDYIAFQSIVHKIGASNINSEMFIQLSDDFKEVFLAQLKTAGVF